jgi:chromate transporter
MPIIVDLFVTFLQISLFTVGGGYAMIPMINSIIVEKGWLSAEQLINFIGIAEAAPGPFAVNVATFVGFEVAGVLGVVMALLGLFLPSFIIVFIIYKVSKKFLQNKHVADAFKALRPAVVGLLICAFVVIAAKTIIINNPQTGQTEHNWFAYILFAASFFVLVRFKKVHPALVIVGSAGIGLLFYSLIL